jgi:hypothetical protein
MAIDVVDVPASPSAVDHAAAPWWDRWATALVVAAVAAAFLPFVVHRPGFVLDDWFTLRNAAFEGAFGAAGPDQELARPGAWLVYAVVFGPLAAHTWAILALSAVVHAATAVLTHRLLRPHLGPGIALTATALWAWLPNHVSTEAWASAANIAVAALALMAGLVLIDPAQPRTRRRAGLALLAASVLCYEATLPLAAVGVVALPWLPTRRVHVRGTVEGALALGAPTAWIVWNWHPAKHVDSGGADLSQVLPAHFGWGVLPAGGAATAGLLVVVLGLVGVLAGWVHTGRGPIGREGRALICGLVVVVLGVLPFVRYFYAPLGAGDRVSVVSSFGGALVWAGLLAIGIRHRREVAFAAVVLVAAAGATRWDRAELWHRAGADAVAIVAGVSAAIPAPDGEIVVGPAPVQEGNLAAFLDRSNIEAALQRAYADPSTRARMATGPDDFAAVDPALRFDLRSVSTLEADVDLVAR